MFHKYLRIIAMLLLSLGPQMAVGQAGSADLTGVVSDSGGALLPDAKVTALNTQTGVSTDTTSSLGGVYVFTSLRPGIYAVAAEANNFQKLVRSGVTLTTGERTRLDFTLVVGSVTESVTVAGDAPLLQTESGSITQSIDHHKIVALPLNGRTFVPLVTLSAGVTLPPGTLLPRINGGRPRTNEYLFDGISALQPEPGQVVFFPIVDSIQEFNVQTNAVPAEFGRFNGGVVNLSTRSGSNGFHGSIWEFFRNEVLNARNYFAPVNQNKPGFRRNQYGAVLGGPIVKDRTFFFVDYQGVKQAIGTVRISTVPTVLERQGNFTELYGSTNPVLYDPATTVQTPTAFTRTPFSPTNIIPTGRIDAAALAVLNHYPQPTAPGTANNFTLVGNDQDHQNQFDTRVDHKFSDQDQIFGRYSYFHDVDKPVPFLPDGSGNITTGVIGLTDTLGQQAVGSYLHTERKHPERFALRLHAALISAPGRATRCVAFAKPRYSRHPVERRIRKRAADFQYRRLSADRIAFQHELEFPHGCYGTGGYGVPSNGPPCYQVRARLSLGAPRRHPAAQPYRRVPVFPIVYGLARHHGDRKSSGELSARTGAAVLD